jgi:hypothetical protein
MGGIIWGMGCGRCILIEEYGGGEGKVALWGMSHTESMDHEYGYCRSRLTNRSSSMPVTGPEADVTGMRFKEMRRQPNLT